MQEQSRRERGVEEGDSLIKTQLWPAACGAVCVGQHEALEGWFCGVSYLPLKRPSSVTLSSLSHPLLTLWARIYSSLHWAPTMSHIVTPLLEHGHFVLCWSVCEVIVPKTGLCQASSAFASTVKLILLTQMREQRRTGAASTGAVRPGSLEWGRAGSHTAERAEEGQFSAKRLLSRNPGPVWDRWMLLGKLFTLGFFFP